MTKSIVMLLTAESRVHSKASSCGIYDGWSGALTRFSPGISVLPC